MEYRIEYFRVAEQHLSRRTKRQQVTVIDAVEERLIFEPVLAVGVKVRNRIKIGEEMVDL